MSDPGPDFGRNPADDPALNAVNRTETFIDALAACRPVVNGDFRQPGDKELTALLEGWRDELRWPPVTGLVSEHDAVVAFSGGGRTRRRRPRRMAVGGSVAATMLALGGFGAVVGGAQPGDALYGLHAMLLGEPQSVHDDRIVLDAKTELDNVAQMITDGQWDQAQGKLAAVNSSVQTVGDTNRRQDLIDRWNQLNAKVLSRDPNATVPFGATP